MARDLLQDDALSGLKNQRIALEDPGLESDELKSMDSTILSQSALSLDWSRSEEDEAWAELAALDAGRDDPDPTT